MGSFWAELKRRNVHRVALGYLAGAWLLIQIADTVFLRIGLSEAQISGLIAVLAIGFVPALILAWIFEWTPEGFRREREMLAAAPRRSFKGLDRVIMVTLILAVGYFAVDKWVLSPGPPGASDRSIIVLPFLNMSSDPDQEYFADGVTEELLNLLAGIPELRVISRSTAWLFKGEKIDVAALQKKLGISHILEGSVRRADDQIRITVQLIDATTDTQLWSETYDRSFDDIFEIQDDISARVVSALRLKLLGGAPVIVEIDPRAYEMYLRARFVVHGYVEGSYVEGEQLLRKVLELEPEFVPAIWELTRLVGRKRAAVTGTAELPRVEAELDALIDRMVEIAPDSSYANGWLALRARYEEHDYQKAAYHFEKAVAGGTDWNIWYQLTRCVNFLSFLGRHEEAAELAKIILRRDPACYTCIRTLGLALRNSGRHQQAAEALETILEWHGPSPIIDWQLGVAWLVAGEPEKARISFDRLRASSLGNLSGLLLLASTGPAEQFEREFAEFRNSQRDNPEGIARIYAWAGQNDMAFVWLDKAVEEYGADFAESVKTDLYGPIKSDPRWQAFLERNGVADQDLSHIKFNPIVPAADWVPVDARPAAR